MKKFLVLCLCSILLISLVSCGSQTSLPDIVSSDKTELELWVYPDIGQWADKESVEAFFDAFSEKYEDITVHITYLSADNADSVVRASMEADSMPDLLLGNVKPLVTEFSAEGYMLDLSDVVEGCGIYPAVLDICNASTDTIYLAPLCIDTYCMAFNQYDFEDGDVLKYADTENHSWNSSDFFDAEIDLFSYGTTNFASIYCGGQNGDQCTRTFVTGLYGGGLVTEDETQYALTSSENLRALKKLVRYKGFRWDDTMLADDSAYLFSLGQYSTTLYWNAELACKYTTDFPVVPMAYPTEDGSISGLPGEVWGFSVFDNGDAEKAYAAKELISYIYKDCYREALKLSGYFSAIEGIKIYTGDPLMEAYEDLSVYIAPEPQHTPNWINMRTAWCDMLVSIGNTDDIDEAGIRAAMEAFDTASNNF